MAGEWLQIQLTQINKKSATVFSPVADKL